MKLPPLTARSEATTRRTYNRPTDDDGTKFETWADTIQRSHHDHHERLWTEAGGKPDRAELKELTDLGMSRAGLVAGRTLWLGGTPYAYSRAASQYNCSGLRLETVYDMVDAFWLLLNGCGVGGLPKAGTLHGHPRRINELTLIGSNRNKDYRGRKENVETVRDGKWTIGVGDSAESWAKALGKLLQPPKEPVHELVLDFSECRGSGGRLKGYGWICNGPEPMADALIMVHRIMNECAGNLLGEGHILDIFNMCGDVLSSRRAAEAGLMSEFHPGVKEFGTRKTDYWKCTECGAEDTKGKHCNACGGRLTTRSYRRQSNNSILFYRRPSVDDIADLLYMNLRGGEPGFVNAMAALAKCPWFDVFNPCFEIMLPSRGFCNLVSLCLPLFGRDFNALLRAVHVMARANYRQTCVDLRDGILQPAWHQTNEALRLCGVSFTGVAQADWLTDYQIIQLRNAAVVGAYSMADELGLPRPKAVTTIKPEGTRSKISGRRGMEIAEGMHKPIGRHVFNWINFSASDPLVDALAKAGYKVIGSPSDASNVLVRFPVEYADCGFDTIDGKAVNLEPAVNQIDRYLRWNNLWADHNVSATISLSREEVPEVARKVYDNWDNGYIATAFLGRTDPTRTAKDLGHPYLPQEVVTEAKFREVERELGEVEWDRFHTGWYEIGDASDCPTGVCPVK